MGEQAAVVDGRRARRERGRTTVIDAMLALLQDGVVPLSADLVAERSGVSVASIFRYFDGLADLQLQAYARFRDRFEPIVAVDPADVPRPLAERVGVLVRSRLDLYEQAGSIMLVGRLRALEHRPLVEASTAMRARLADQVRMLLGGPADVVAAVDALTSLDAWDVMRRTHGLGRARITTAWTRGVTLLVTGTSPATDPEEPT